MEQKLVQRCETKVGAYLGIIQAQVINMLRGLASIPINLSLTALNQFFLHGLKIYLD